MAVEELFASVTIPSIICNVEEEILPAADIISPTVPPIVSPSSSNSLSTLDKVLYNSCHSLILRLSGDVLSLLFILAIRPFVAVTFARCTASSFPFVPPSFSMRANSCSASVSNRSSSSKLIFVILFAHV